jgi:hypothetical protein
MDMYGGLVDLVETRASLMASHGFAAFALSYQLLEEHLPQSMDKVDFEYLKV